MPNGIGEGWPAKQAGTKVTAVVEDELYALDPSSTMDTDFKESLQEVRPSVSANELGIYEEWNKQFGCLSL
ncbi:hypothetical protein Droror1_Dr00018562 [Drosera rotundifolia]